MKKTIFTFILFFLITSNVKSLSWESELPIGKNIMIDKIEERYKWYKLKRVNERIENAFENNCEYFDIIDSTFNEWSSEIPIEMKEQMINCYDYEKEYIEGYFTNMDGYIKDEESKKIFYKYSDYICDYNIDNRVAITSDNEIHEYPSVINDEQNKLAINYNTKNQTEEYELIPLFIVALGGILILLVLICRKMKKNMKECR